MLLAALSLALGAPRRIVSTDGYRLVPNVAYLGPKRRNRLDAYVPSPPADGSLMPAIVWIHGGGWTHGNKSSEHDAEVCRTLASNGYVTVSVGYRLGDDVWPGNLMDCKTAVQFLRVNAQRLHLDPDRIGVAGGSAGGHLALMVGLTPGRPELEPPGPYLGVSDTVRCIVDLYGPTDLQVTKPRSQPYMVASMRRFARAFGARALSDDVLRQASPIRYVDASAPPTLILHGRADAVVDVGQSEDIERAFKDKGVPCASVYLDGVGHGFDLEKSDSTPLPRDLRPIVLSFLGKYLAARHSS